MTSNGDSLPIIPKTTTDLQWKSKYFSSKSKIDTSKVDLVNNLIFSMKTNTNISPKKVKCLN